MWLLLLLSSGAVTVTQAAPIPFTKAVGAMQQHAVHSSSAALSARSILQQVAEELTPRDPSGPFDKGFWDSEEFLKAFNKAKEEASDTIPSFSLPQSATPTDSGALIPKMGRPGHTVTPSAWSEAQQHSKHKLALLDKSSKKHIGSSPSGPMTEAQKQGLLMEEQLRMQQAGTSTSLPERSTSAKSRKRSKIEGDSPRSSKPNPAPSYPPPDEFANFPHFLD